ncbi:type VI secretion system baseplate subunit TssG [Parasulfitobacter algicola]|uniref:Type VI secretion system baseplate subunit TssG n=1 Tax=Parasulfitobacter algicola TaxID=2614809 RepID=A0ABX2ILH9_9RHOB|nr:type VI secretion system baseplate subunit TssG [Sulfitobacter algicola]NSX53731.1 type VI secretion system baseplate subunit TssG [Sulfitobacter algicola]
MNKIVPVTDPETDAVFANLQADPAAFDPISAIRIAEAEAKVRGLDLVISAPPLTSLQPTPVSAVIVKDDRIQVEASLAGLVGPLSPLPPAYTEMITLSNRRRSYGLGAFFDLFSDRLTWLFIHAAEKYSLPVLLRWNADGKNRIRTALFSLIGLSSGNLRRHTTLPKDGLLRYAGLLAQRTRSAQGLRAVLAAELQLPVQVKQFHNRWLPIPVSEQTNMASNTRTPARLGQNTTAGAYLPERSGKIRIVVGPVRYHDFLALEPGTDKVNSLQNLIRLYLGPVLDFDIQVILAREDVPDTQLGGAGPMARLGWNTWAKSAESDKDSDQAVIEATV